MEPAIKISTKIDLYMLSAAKYRPMIPVPRNIKYMLIYSVQTYRALHDDAPQYLRQFTSVAEIPTRQRLWSSTSDDLCVPAVRLPTVGRRAFSVANNNNNNNNTFV